MGYDSNDWDDGTIERCPFCKGEGILKVYTPPFTARRYFYVQCDKCGAMTSPVYITPDDAIGRWNRRQDDV